MNRTNFLLLILFTMSWHILEAQTVNYQEMFFKANELYKDGKYKEAQDLYEAIPNKTPHVLYNLGNCAYKLGKQGYALLFWRRAERNWGLFNRTELSHNIAMIKKNNDHTNDQDSPINRIKIMADDAKNTVISTARAMPLSALQLLFLFMWAVSFLYLRYLYRKRHKTIIVLLFIANISCGSILAIRYNFEYRQHGIVIIKQTSLMSGPGKNYQELGVLPEAKQMLIKGMSDDFYKVKVNGGIGWVEKKAIEIY